MNKEATILEVINMNLSYPGKTIVEDANFSIHAGEVVLLLGDNGSGKSSIIESIRGNLAGTSRNEKKVVFQGAPIKDGGDLEAFQRSISYVGQFDHSDDFFALKVKDYIGDYVRESAYAKEHPEVVEGDIKEACEKFGLEDDVMSRSLRKISGGQFRLASIVRAFARAHSSLYIFDEPINNLDATKSRRLNNELIKLKNREDHPGILIITHCQMFTKVDSVFALRSKKLIQVKLGTGPGEYEYKTCYGNCDECGFYKEEER
jgi:ABC-type multidrug transport system ATPase subunit